MQSSTAQGPPGPSFPLKPTLTRLSCPVYAFSIPPWMSNGQLKGTCPKRTPDLPRKLVLLTVFPVMEFTSCPLIKANFILPVDQVNNLKSFLTLISSIPPSVGPQILSAPPTFSHLLFHHHPALQHGHLLLSLLQSPPGWSPTPPLSLFQSVLTAARLDLKKIK